MEWSEQHRREQQSDRNTGRGGKRGFETDCWEQRKPTALGLEMNLGTPPEPEPGKMSSTVKTL